MCTALTTKATFTYSLHIHFNSTVLLYWFSLSWGLETVFYGCNFCGFCIFTSNNRWVQRQTRPEVEDLRKLGAKTTKRCVHNRTMFYLYLSRINWVINLHNFCLTQNIFSVAQCSVCELFWDLVGFGFCMSHSDLSYSWTKMLFSYWLLHNSFHTIAMFHALCTMDRRLMI